ncbi:MAG: hypothetical protein HYY92_02415 [Parcubacteria group bacterium]|nr:hypothetical protein [Parcubacteria group bacterium]
MSSSQAGTRAEQARALKGGSVSQSHPRAIGASEETLEQFGTEFIKLKSLLSDSEEREVLVGKILDDVRVWVKGCVETLLRAWDAIQEAEEGDEVLVALEKRARERLREFEKLLAGEGISGIEELTSFDRALVARVAAIYYAAAVWSAGEVPTEEVVRALRFLMKAGAARVTRDEPVHGVRSIRVLSSAWIAFPSISPGKETPDVRAMEKSGLLSFASAIAHYARKDADGFGKSRESALKGSVIISSPDAVEAFLAKPHAWKILLRVHSEYRKKTNRYRSGGMALVAVRGDDESGYSLHIENVFDDHLLSSLRDASEKNKEARLLPEIHSLSAFLHDTLPQGTYLSAIEVPMDFFGINDLRNWDVDVGERKGGTLRAFCEVVLVVRGAFLRAMLEQKPARKNGAKPVGDGQASDNRSEKTRGEAVEDLKAALVKEGEKNRLPIRDMAEFFSPKQPHGVTLVEVPGALYVGKEGEKVAFEKVACVLARHKDGARARIVAFPPRLEGLFDGKNDGLIFARLIRHAKWLFHNPGGKGSVGGEQTPKEDTAETASSQNESGGIAETPPSSQSSAKEAPAQTEAETANEPVVSAPSVPEQEAPTPPEESGASGNEETAPAATEVNVWASPQARTRAEELGVAGEKITPQRGKKVTKADVESHAARE